MKSAKKILLLVLSLMLLVGIFAVAAFAEDTGATATVVYPDGTTDTVAVGDTIIPKEFKTEGDAKLYYGAGNTLYKDAGEGWIFTLEKFTEPLTDLTVTNDMAGRNIIATGADKVYFTHTTDGVTEYNTSLSTHATNLRTLLTRLPEKGVDIKLYADVSVAKFSIYGCHGVENYFDLNGHRFTITGTSASYNAAIEVRAPHFAMYSSAAGAVVVASEQAAFCWTNDDGAGYCNTDELKATCTYGGYKHTGTFFFGERVNVKTSTVKEYGQNITVICQSPTIQLYGNGNESAFLGGTFVQTGSAASFVKFAGRSPTVKNCSFVITNAATVPVVPSSTKTFVNCNFVYAGEGSISLSNAATAGYFNDCNFVNITPSYNVAHTYNANCAFGTTSCYPTEALTDSVYLAHGTTSKEITVNGVTYTLDGALISDPTETLALTRGELGTDYWMVGATVASDAGLAPFIVDGKIYSGARYDYSAIAQIDAGVVTTAGTATAPIEYASVKDAAFTYQVDGEEMQFVASLGTPEEDGANFVLLLNDVCNVKIVMYTDIVLPSGVRFGTMVDVEVTYTSDNKTTTVTTQKPYYTGPGKGGSASVFGSVDWDLNGNTVTVAADATPISMIAWVESQGPQRNSVLHYPGYAKFNLYSSVAGGEYINLSAIPIFGINKYSNPSYLLGTTDKDVDGGENLTIVSNAPISLGYECTENGPAGYNLIANGGTYVSSTNGAVFSVGQTAKIMNAKILSTGGAYTIVANHFWSPTNLTLDNVVMIANHNATKMVDTGTYAAHSDSGKNHTISLNNNVAFAGGTLELAYTKATFTVNGTIMTDTAENLAVAYPTAPEGQTLAYTGISVYGTPRKCAAYYENPTIVTVQNAALNTVENWLIGADYVSPALDPNTNVVIDGDIYYYRPNPVWTATVDGTVVENICAEENAGKTAILTVGGDAYRILFTATFNGKTTYYYNRETAGADFKALLTPSGAYTYEIKLYNDVEAPATTIGKAGTRATYKIDANGYTLRFKKTTTAKVGYILHSNSIVYWYSTEPGGAFDFSECKQMACCDKSGYGYFGEPVNDGSTTYGKNVTFYFDALHGYMYSTGLSFIGGTYIQVENPISTAMFDGRNTSYPTVIRNCTFIFKKVDVAIFWGACFGNGNTIVNCNFICEAPTNLFLADAKDKATTFQNCNFYNVICNTLDVGVTYTDCKFSLSSLDAQTGGYYIAYTGETDTLNINGKDYVFGAQLLAADQVALVEWGFGMEEYWQIGAEATHKNTVVDGVFGYQFAPVEVVAGENKATATLVAIKPGALQMNLTLQSKIGLNILVSETLGNLGATVKIDGTAYTLDELVNGAYTLEKAIAPSDATKSVCIEITIGENVHEVNVSVGAYAETILGDAQYAAAHDLTYAMVEYVRVMEGNADFANVEAPAEYAKQTLTAAAPENDGTLLSSIAFQLDGTIAIAIKGTADAEGKDVNLVLATGRSEWATVNDAASLVIFDDLYVNEFYGTMTIKIDNETYTYSLANYLKGIEADYPDEATAVQALYNYAYYADDYVRNVLLAQAN